MATLKEIRERFRKKPIGRFDLVTAAGADNGADWYIQAGQRMLDSMQPTPLREAEFYKILSSGDWWIKVPKAYAVLHVWLENDDGEHSDLDYKMLDALLALYPKLELTAAATPAHWTLSITRTGADATEGPTATDADAVGYTNVLIMPPALVAAGEVLTLRVYGQYESHTLSDDGDESYWSIAHPDLLVMAALYKLDREAGNNTRANELYAELARALRDIDRELVEQDMVHGSVMEG